MGELTKTTSKELFLEQFDTHRAYIDTLDPKVIARIKQQAATMRHGLHVTAPIMCAGPDKCLFIEHCPIPPRNQYGAPIMDSKGNMDYGEASHYPIARTCVMETLFMQQKIIDYLEHLDVDPDNPIEMSIVNELALIDLLKNRALIILSKGDRKGQGQDLMKVDTSYDAETGAQLSESSNLHPAANFIDSLEKRREKWLDKLVETRKSKLDMASKLGNSDKDNLMLQEIRAVREAIEAASNKVIDENEILEIEFKD